MARSLDDLRQAIRTVIGITVTPFDEQGRIAEAAYQSLVSRTVGAGITATGARQSST